jgi:hypothetical protein
MRKTLFALALLLASGPGAHGQNLEELKLWLTFENKSELGVLVKVDYAQVCTIAAGGTCNWHNFENPRPGAYLVQIERPDGSTFDDAVSAAGANCRSFSGYSYTYTLNESGVKRSCP